MNLQVLPLSDLQSFAYQKCLIPQELFPKRTLPGALAKCKLSSGAEYICNIYPMTNQAPPYFCWLDDNLKVGAIKNTISSRLTSLEVLNNSLQPASRINLAFTINEKLFEIDNINREFLIDIAKKILQPYNFVNNSFIVLKELQEIGIAEIHVQSKDSNVFKFTDTTEVIVSNVRLQTSGEECQFSNLVAMEEPQEELQQLIENMSVYENLTWKMKPSLNALVIGPTGSGKTSICMNFVVENNSSCYIIRSGNILGQYPGETEAELRRIFQSVKLFIERFQPNDPVVILIEDLDLICPGIIKNSTDSGNSMRVSGQLISLLDDLRNSMKSSKVIVLATSSRPEAILSTLRRPGRFGIEINIPALNENHRQAIFASMVKNSFYGRNFALSDELLHTVAKQTQGFVAADLELLINSIGQELLRSDMTLEKFTEILGRSLKTMKPASFQGTDVKVFKTDETFNSIGGMEHLKKTLEISVLAGLKQKAAFDRFGLCLPKGILLYGPPGCAKTTVAKCLATEAKMTFIPTSAAEVYSPYVGNSEKYISKIFDTARKNSPCLVFLDEIDSLVGKRAADAKSDVQTRILSTLLTEMDGIGVKLFSSTPGGNSILVVAATNRPEMIDDALMRPGRFDRLIHVPAPDRDSRLEILQIHAQKMPFHGDVELEEIADATELYSGADMCNLCNEAAMYAFTQNIDVEDIKMEDFQRVLKCQKSSLTQTQIDWYKNFEGCHRR
ncbi:ribosome biogenesis protein SPATA5L1 [Eupeodes corollae]|uniref:ribosome biogenesis protein SPATA5L1 n=1 Tax=Eupeodes corollae TaxID=290404 RepID=UPI0024931E9D|nr:ribosome biogenesis protein SPATA5L1 [Eupeodes corollae]